MSYPVKRSRLLDFSWINRLAREEPGVALLIALIALTIFSALGFYMAFNSVTEVRISDNYESHVQAREAALAGINHTRELLRGIEFDDQLKGPDGTYNNSGTYLAVAKTYAFRNPLPWALARSADISNPGPALATFPDDGLLNTGKVGTTPGLLLVPLPGIVQTAPNPYGAGTIITSRYFVKVTDNNGESTEVAADTADNPFVDGDGTVIVRSMGIARTLREISGGALHANSVAVYEARFYRFKAFNLGSPFVLEGPDVAPSAPNMFDGNAFLVDGGANFPGIGTIDTDPTTGVPLEDQISSQVDRTQMNNIRGVGGFPSIDDITGTVQANPDTARLMDPNYLHTFITEIIPPVADECFYGPQDWHAGTAPDLGYYDPTKPPNDPSQRPRIIYVDGDLNISGNIEGGGVLIITGKLSGNARFIYHGLILVIGQGDVNMAGWNIGLDGGMFVANLTESSGTYSFGTTKFTFSGNSNIVVNADSLRMAMDMFPLKQLSLREVTSMLDP